MERHFIESYKDERDVLRKIEELKTEGYAETDMYVVARTNEQLTMVRTRTDVDYHSADGNGMGRLGTFFRNGLIHPYMVKSNGAISAAEEFYEYLLEGKLLLFCNKNSDVDLAEQDQREAAVEYRASKAFSLEKTPFLQRQRDINVTEDEITIDRKHYETFQPLEAVPLENRADAKRKKDKH